MNFKKVYMSIHSIFCLLILSACQVTPDTGFEAGVDDWITYSTKKGSGFMDVDNKEFTHHNGTVGNTYVLYIKDPTSDTTYLWSTTTANVSVQPSADKHSATIKILKHNIYDEKVFVSSAGQEVASAYFTAGEYKVRARKSIDGVFYRVEFIDNFNDMTFIKKNWITEWSSDTSNPGNLKRPYWRNDALSISDNTLAMSIKKDPNGAKHFTTKNHSAHPNKTAYISGGIHRKDTETGNQKLDVKGYVETRVRMEKKSPNHWNAFWSYHAKPQADIGNDIEYEYDVMEYANAGSSFEQTTHWWLKEGGKMIDSQTQHVDANPGLKNWIVLGMLWTDDEIVYYSGPTADDMKVTARMNRNGTASINEFEISEGEIQKFKEEGQEVIPSYPQNWKFTTELGTFGKDRDGHAIDTLLQNEIGNGADVMYVDYFVRYVSTF